MFDMAGIAVEIGQALLSLALAPALVGFIRWLKARMQNRRGAPIWQPYAELRKLFRKEMVVSRNASWVFHLAPFVVFGSTMVVSLLVPVLVTPLPFNAVADLFAVVYLLLLGTFVPRAGRPRHRFGVRRHGQQPRDDDRGAQRADHRAGHPLARARPPDRRTWARSPPAPSPGRRARSARATSWRSWRCSS